MTACIEKHSTTAKVSSPIGIGKAEGAARGRPSAAGLGAREVRVAGDVDDPGRAAGRGDAARKADAGGERCLLGQRRGTASNLVGWPRCQTCEGCSGSCSLLPRHVDVADGPARPAADVLDAGAAGPRRSSRPWRSRRRRTRSGRRRRSRSRTASTPAGPRALRRATWATVAAVAPAPTRAAIWARRSACSRIRTFAPSSEPVGMLFSRRCRSVRIGALEVRERA